MRARLKITPDDAEAARQLVAQLSKEGRIAEANTLLISLTQTGATTPGIHVVRGEFLAAQKNNPEALDAFETALELNPNLPEAQAGFRKAAIAFALQASHAGAGEQALSILERASETLPADVELQRSYGIEAMALSRTSLALQILQNTLKLAPNDPDSLLALARAEMNGQLTAESEAHFRLYLVMRPSDAGAHYGFGRLLTMQQKDRAAEAEFRKSIALQPRQDASYYEMGQLALDAQDNQTAAIWFGKALQFNATHGGALTGMGILAYRNRDFAGAEAMLRRATAAAPDYIVAHYYLGLSLARLHRDDESRQELERARALQPAPIKQ